MNNHTSNLEIQERGRAPIGTCYLGHRLKNCNIQSMEN